MAIEPTPQSQAFEEQYREAFRRLRKMFSSRGVPHEEAADLAQEAATRLLVHIERNGVDPIHDELTPLLNRIAANLLVDHIRASARRVISLDEADIELDDDPVDEVVRRHRSMLVRQAIEELPARQRDALVMSLAGHGPADIAKHLGLQRNAADALLYRARRGLAERLHGMRTDLHGIALLAMWRVRSFFKRATGAETAAAMSPAFAGLVSAALSIALSMPAATASTVATRAPLDTNRPSTTTLGAAQTVARAQTAHAVRSARTRTVVVDPRGHRFGVHTTVRGPGGRRTPLGLDVWQERDGDRGVTGPLIDDATDAACQFVPCWTPGG